MGRIGFFPAANAAGKVWLIRCFIASDCSGSRKFFSLRWPLTDLHVCPAVFRHTTGGAHGGTGIDCDNRYGLWFAAEIVADSDFAI